MLISILFFGFCFFTLIQLLFFCVFFLRFAIHKLNNNSDNTVNEAVSVILAVKNEAHLIKCNLRSFLEQNYNNYEVIVVNNNSEDNTASLLKEYQHVYPHLKVVNISTNQVNVLEKKMSLAVGIKSAQHEIILLSDIGSTPKSVYWIREMAKHYLENRYVVLGYAAYEKNNTLLNTIIRYDNTHTAICYFSYALSGFPYRGNARNLSYPRSLFLSNYNYILLYNSQVIDEDLFANQIMNKKNTAIEYRKEAHILSQQPHSSFRDWLRHKRLSGRKGKNYSLKKSFLVGLYNFTGFFFYLTWIITIVLSFYNQQYLWFILLLFILRMSLQWFIFGKCIRKLDEKTLIKKIPLLDVFFMLIMPILEIDKNFHKKKKWK